MAKSSSNKKYHQILEEGFKKQIPKIRKEIKVYETHLKNGQLNKNPKVAPQFNP